MMNTVVIDMSTAIAIMGYCALVFFALFTIRGSDTLREMTGLSGLIPSGLCARAKLSTRLQA